MVNEGGAEGMNRNKDRIECAIRHIQTAVDIDPWARDLAVEALRKELERSDQSENPDVPDTNVGDMISRQAAIKVMTSVLWHLPNERYRNLNEYEFSKGLAELGLNSVPSTQPEIIRCKECKWKQGSECTRFAEVRPFPDDFCSRAERKTDGSD